MTSNNILTVTSKHQLKDGFQEIFVFRGHRLQLRGFNLVEWLEDTRKVGGGGSSQSNARHHFYLSWDIKQMLLWKHDFQTFGAKPELVNQIKFSNQPNYICAIVHATKMKVFLAAALDMSFKIFNRNLEIIESIHHEERAIIQLEYDLQRDIIFSSGATGISAWKLYRNMSLEKSHVMEKLYSFEGCDSWVTRMIYDPTFDRIYALKERSAQVLSISRRGVIAALENVHESPINAICWYERNQFYITGCSRGEVKCWTSNFSSSNAGSNNTNHSSPASSPHHHESIDGVREHSPLRASSSGPGSSKKFALLHKFKGHSKAVTAIKLHPVSGLAISTSLDGFVKILNLEALNELFTIQCEAGVVNMRLLRLENNHHACLFAFTDATIRLWKITSVCDFFAVSAAPIRSFQSFDNLEGETEYYHRTSRHYHNINANSPYFKGSQQQAAFGEYKVGKLFPTNNNNNRLLHDSVSFKDRASPVKEDNDNSSIGNHNSVIDEELEELYGGPGGGVEKTLDVILSERIIVAESSQDFRAFTETGTLLGRLEPEHVVDAILAYTVSVHQKLLICLCEGDKIRVHCLRRFGFPLIYETNLKGPSAGGTSQMHQKSAGSANEAKGKQNHNQQKDISEQLATCLGLLDIAPNNSIRSPRIMAAEENEPPHIGGLGSTSNEEGIDSSLPMKRDLRGEAVPDYMECFLMIGLNTGTILFLDLYSSLEIILSFQSMHGIICDLKYRKKYHELFMYGKDFTGLTSTIRIYKLPELELVCSISDVKHISCFNIAPTMNLFGLGCQTGAIRLFHYHTDHRSITEVIRTSENHEQKVTSICFCDELQVYTTCSADFTVNFWDYEKRLIRTVVLSMPTASLILNGLVGDVIMSQNHYLLTIPRRIWDEDNMMLDVKRDPLEQEKIADVRFGRKGENFIARNESQDATESEKDKEKKARKSSGAVQTAGKKKSSVTILEDRKASESKNTTTTAAAIDMERRRSSLIEGSSVISALSDSTNPVGGGGSVAPATTNELNASANAPPVATQGNRKASILDRRMSRRLSQLDSKRRFSSLVAKHKAAVPLPVAEGLAGIGPEGGKSLLPGEESTVKSRPASGHNIERLIDNMKELFEREVVLPQLQDNYQVVVKVQPTSAVNAKDMSEEIGSTSLDYSRSEAEVMAQMTRQEVPFRPHPPEATIAVDSSSNQKKPAKPTSNSYDTLHPKFILHKKPPARAMKLEDIQAKLEEYKSKLQPQNSTAPVNPSNEASSTRVHSRRFAQFGLSPRARLTLLNSYELDEVISGDNHQPLDPHTSSASPRKTSLSPSRKASILASTGTTLDFRSPEEEKLIEASIEHRLQEQLVMGLGLGMKVSSQYKKQRMTMKQQDTFTLLNQKIQSMTRLPGLSEGNPNWSEEDGFDSKIFNSKKFNNPRVGFMGRKMMPGTEPISSSSLDSGNLGTREEIDDLETFSLLNAGNEEENTSEKEDGVRTTEVVGEDESNSGGNSPSGGNVPQYSRRKPLLPSSFIGKDLK